MLLEVVMRKHVLALTNSGHGISDGLSGATIAADTSGTSTTVELHRAHLMAVAGCIAVHALTVMEDNKARLHQAQISTVLMELLNKDRLEKITSRPTQNFSTSLVDVAGDAISDAISADERPDDDDIGPDAVDEDGGVDAETTLVEQSGATPRRSRWHPAALAAPLPPFPDLVTAACLAIGRCARWGQTIDTFLMISSVLFVTQYGQS